MASAAQLAIQDNQSSAEQSAIDVLLPFTSLRQEVLDHLYKLCEWNDETREWVIPKKETFLAVHTPNYWENALGYQDAAVVSSTATFFEQEADHNRGNKPRLDIVLLFSDGRTARYHPKAKLIWSDELQPTDAMQKRLNLASKIRKRVHKRTNAEQPVSRSSCRVLDSPSQDGTSELSEMS